MKNNEKIKKIQNPKLSLLNDNIHIQNLNNSFQVGCNKLKQKYSFIEKLNLINFKKTILSKITQLQYNQQKTNHKLSSLISILFSKLIGNQNYSVFHSHFTIFKENKINNNDNEIEKYIKNNINIESKQTINNTERNIDNHNIRNNSTVKKIGTISLETELEIRRYTLSNQKTKSKEQIFKNKEKRDKKENEDEINFYNNLFKINYNNNIINNKKNDYYYSSLNKNSSSENLKISKKILNSDNRKPIAFNEVNQSNTNKNYFSGGINETNKIVFSENNLNRRVYINALNIHNNSCHNINIKSNIPESRSTKGPVKIKLNQTEKPILLINLNENNSDKNKNSKHYKNIMKIYKNSDDKRLSLQIEDLSNNKNDNQTINEDNTINNDDIKIRRKYSESKSEAEINFSHSPDTKHKSGYSRKIRGFNFRNNIKYNKNQNSEDEYIKIKGGSVRYDNNGNLFSQINSLEN